MVDEPKRYLTTNEAARYIGCQPQTLRQKRHRGDGPPYVRFGRGPGARCLYALADLDAWIRERTHTSTADEYVANEVAAAGR
ncbi:MAG TPA: helix-turn-helix domain-containing protein [Thermoanaerobaculaceae bacterium]|nr:helix-turn-helix domain-containing protein [Thermoanaerobaculaceae bacterium]HRS16584.1 helix-turn-helix domain-containing protein [Thermoanaerobaculaceae bacterium]